VPSGGEWWFHENGDNMLAGVEGDTDNPIRLPDDYIIAFLLTIPAARESFARVVPNMLPEEQERLNALRYEGVAVDLAYDHRAVDDTFMRVQNVAGVRTCGPRGGGSWAPPPMEES